MDARESDRTLCRRFVADGDEAALEAIVQRHGAMVRGVCCRVLQDADPDDAVQVTFMVFARKASGLCRLESLGPWLHGTALRVARTQRRQQQRRSKHQRAAGARHEASVESIAETEAVWCELKPVLDEELDRLPRRYRDPVVLCYLQGRTQTEAAEELGWSKGTVSGRLARAKEVLRKRLSRRGIAMPVAVLAALLSRAGQAEALSAASATGIATAAAHAAGLPSAATCAVSAPVMRLMEGVERMIYWSRLTTVLKVALLVVAGSLALLTPLRLMGASAGDTRPRPAPDGVELTVATNQVHLRWKSNSDYAVVNVARRIAGSDEWVTRQNVYPGMFWFRDGGLRPHTTYNYRLTVFTDKRKPDPRFEPVLFTVSTLSADTPNIRSNKGSSTVNSVHLRWRGMDPSPERLLIEQQDEDGEWQEIAQARFREYDQKVRGLEPDTAYHFRARAEFSNGRLGPYSPEYTVRTALPDDAPPIVSFECIDVSHRSCRLRFRFNRKHPDVRGRRMIIQRRKAHEREWEVAWAGRRDFDEMPDRDLEPGTTYIYRLALSEDAKEVLEDLVSDEIEVQTLPLGTPDAPDRFDVVVSSDSAVRLSWSYGGAPLPRYNAGFIVERRGPDEDEYRQVARIDAGKRTYDDKGLTPGTRYSYRMTAFAGRQQSSPTPTVDVQVLKEMPPLPPKDDAAEEQPAPRPQAF